mmetsp:Transcript_81925/g.265518  ORF Transcript_81925/g.265518 Transcript_81925/m.265518 type:complete len:549 (+) Transcript_81925:980-2626(+)
MERPPVRGHGPGPGALPGQRPALGPGAEDRGPRDLHRVRPVLLRWQRRSLRWQGHLLRRGPWCSLRPQRRQHGRAVRHLLDRLGLAGRGQQQHAPALRGRHGGVQPAGHEGPGRRGPRGAHGRPQGWGGLGRRLGEVRGPGGRQHRRGGRGGPGHDQGGPPAEGLPPAPLHRGGLQPGQRLRLGPGHQRHQPEPRGLHEAGRLHLGAPGPARQLREPGLPRPRVRDLDRALPAAGGPRGRRGSGRGRREQEAGGRARRPRPVLRGREGARAPGRSGRGDHDDGRGSSACGREERVGDGRTAGRARSVPKAARVDHFTSVRATCEVRDTRASPAAGLHVRCSLPPVRWPALEWSDLLRGWLHLHRVWGLLQPMRTANRQRLLLWLRWDPGAFGCRGHEGRRWGEPGDCVVALAQPVGAGRGLRRGSRVGARSGGRRPAGGQAVEHRAPGAGPRGPDSGALRALAAAGRGRGGGALRARLTSPPSGASGAVAAHVGHGGPGAARIRNWRLSRARAISWEALCMPPGPAEAPSEGNVLHGDDHLSPEPQHV